MLADMIKEVNYEEERVNKLQIFGILHLGLRVQATRLWRAGGSITIYYKDPQVYYISNKFSAEGVKNFLKFLAMIYRYKVCKMKFYLCTHAYFFGFPNHLNSAYTGHYER
jgi:hypothetical protein